MTDRSTVLAVVVALAVVAFATVIGIITLVALNKSAEALAVVSATGAPAVGALAALLANPRSSPPTSPDPETAA